MYISEEKKIKKENLEDKLNRILADKKKSRNLNANPRVATSLIKDNISNFKNVVTPVDKQINLDVSKVLMTKTDSKGLVEFANTYFFEVNAYKEYELVGENFAVIEHPEMPKIIGKLVQNKLAKGESTYAIVKNIAKDGRFYWVISSFRTKLSEEGKESYYIYSKAAPNNLIYSTAKLYKKLKTIELKHGEQSSKKYFNGLIEEKEMTYNSFVLDQIGVDEDTILNYFNISFNESISKSKKRSLFKRLFK